MIALEVSRNGKRLCVAGVGDNGVVTAMVVWNGRPTRTRCYVAVHDPVGCPYRLAAVDRQLGEVRWVTKVWGSWWGDATGQHHQWLEVTEQGDRVVVFGRASGTFHVEAFRADDGANLFRFSNSYGAR
jgi:hypothetical protein